MIITKENRRTIYEALFKEGVLVAPKDFNRPAHPDMPTVRNLEVVKAMQSLTSRGFVKTQFSWQWYYYTLTDEGLAYLREYLHLPSEIVPQTHLKPARPATRPAGGAGARTGGGDGAYRAPRGDREYRRRDDAGAEGKEGAGAEYRPRFGGVGRGAGAPPAS
ncbi:Plectin/S10 domain-containing protein [Dioszegia hungarica]|uniref:Plectin/S10 domain-containing protein n=1 Tax=Dioszegia hungarica TaxID=4972 RepID=A0AA38HAF5_9TREE|nr:Plectin/S10 domain-containing protein [Dioszegia hungarica]KAI9636963.1 Plectin/S10 domain-containing protein [Dioszegia hungarica]